MQDGKAGYSQQKPKPLDPVSRFINATNFDNPPNGPDNNPD
ncbi:hypothetical protein SP21_35 [Salmonella phage 21]|nr:hypothetical protein SP21_35 [Salmonella phage 21]